MKQISTFWLMLSIVCLSQLPFSGFGQSSGTLTAFQNTYITQNCNGFYVYTPSGYTTSKKYPLLVLMHGAGEMGNGNTQLSNLTGTGVLNLIKNNKFPSSFTVNSSTYQFVIIEGQYKVAPNVQDMDSTMDYAEKHYSIDVNREYLTGYSQGSADTWFYIGQTPVNTPIYKSIYAKRIAAALPIESPMELQVNWGQTIASNNVPILATHNIGDPQFSYMISQQDVNTVNSSNPPPVPLAQLVILSGTPHDGWDPNSHDGWDLTYNPALFTFNGLNVYQWMLQYTRNLATSLPVQLGAYTATLTGRNAVIVNWTTLTETNNQNFILDRSADGTNFITIGNIPATNKPNGDSYSFTDPSPLKGNNYYRLSQVDIDGHVTYFNVLDVVVAASSQAYFKLNPNPVSNYVQLELAHPENGPIVVNLYDMEGRVLQSWKFDKQNPVWTQWISLGNYAPGSYTLQIRGTTIREAQQFIKH